MTECVIFNLGHSNSEKSVKMTSKQQAYFHVLKSTWHFPRSTIKATAGKPYLHARLDIVFTICRRTTD